MTASDYAQCVSELAGKKVVFDQPGEVTRQGCHLSGAITLTLISTPFGEVALPAKPTMLCSFGRRFSDWVRDVAAPMTPRLHQPEIEADRYGPRFRLHRSL
jgi:hypothetical protein